jgi:hypothetical protein
MILKKNSDVLCAIKYHKQRISQVILINEDIKKNL